MLCTAYWLLNGTEYQDNSKERYKIDGHLQHGLVMRSGCSKSHKGEMRRRSHKSKLWEIILSKGCLDVLPRGNEGLSTLGLHRGKE
jgi:hypothetical protein